MSTPIVAILPDQPHIGTLPPLTIVSMIQQAVNNFDGTPREFVLAPKQHALIDHAVIGQIIRATGLECVPSMEAEDFEIIVR